MECSVCWNLLSESPDMESGSPPPAKIPKESETEPLGPLSVGTVVSTVTCTPCGHLFHRDCLLKWFTGSGIANIGNCPTCRRVLLQSTLYPVFLEAEKENSGNRKRKSLLEKASSLKEASTTSDKATSPNRTIKKSKKDALSSSFACEEEECQDLYQRHNLLMKDFELLQAKCNQEMERADMNEAKALSLEHSTTYRHEILLDSSENTDSLSSSYSDWLEEIRVKF